jgi:hypothetical protein
LLLDRARVDADVAARAKVSATLDEEALRALDVGFIALEERDRRRHVAVLAGPRFHEVCRVGDTVVFEVRR